MNYYRGIRENAGIIVYEDEAYDYAIHNLTEDEKKEVIENELNEKDIVDFFFWDNWLKEEEDEDDEEYVKPSWSEEYLNTLGMSLSDFL